jgi:hypothetical protein
MPKATVDPELHYYDLQTCPGGFIKLRALSFHEMQMRMDIAGRMYQEEKVAKVKNTRQRSEEEIVRGYFEIMNVAVTEFEFRNCVVEHNLYIDEAETQLIDFTKPMHTWKLDPKVGAEIAKYIGELTQIEEDDLLPLPTVLSSSSSAEKIELTNSTDES